MNKIKTTIKPRTSNYCTHSDRVKTAPIRKAIVISTANKKVYKEILK